MMTMTTFKGAKNKRIMITMMLGAHTRAFIKDQEITILLLRYNHVVRFQ